MAKPEYFDGTEWQSCCGDGADVSVQNEPGTPIPITGSLTISAGSVNMTLGAELDALSAFSQNGLMVRTGTGSYAGRTLIAGTGINITNGNGVAGNPVISTTGLSLTLTGAVTGSGSGSGTINTTLGENQSLPFSYLQNNWSSGDEKGIYHTLIDAATPPHFVHKVQSGSGSTYRRWLTVYKPGFGSHPTGSYQLGFYHAANGHQYPFEIGTYGSTLRTYLRTTVDVNNNKIINLAEPSSSNDAATRNYVDNEIESAVTPAIFQDAIKHLSYYTLIDLSSSNSSNLDSSDHCPFNNIRSNNDPENLMNLSTSCYSTSAGVHSLGRVKLRVGYIYKIRGFVSSTGTSSYFGFSLYDVTSSTYRFGTYGSSFAATPQDQNADSSPSIGYIKAVQDTLIELRKTGGAITQWYMGNSNLSGCWLDIQIIGKI